MHVARIVLRVANLDRSVAFWSDVVGLGLTSRSGSFAFLDGGHVQVVLNEMEAAATNSLTEVVLEVQDFPDCHAALVTRGVPFEIAPRPVMTDGGRDLMAAHFRDPDGNLASVTGWVDHN